MQKWHKQIFSEVLLSKLLTALFAVTFIFGLYASVHTGLTWDESIEQQTFAVNMAAVKGLLTGDNAPYQALVEYRDKYYGIGFHALAYPLQSLIAPILEAQMGVSAEAALLLAKHPLVFLAFAGSVVLFYMLLRIFIEQRWLCLLLANLYFLFPYLLGHALFNVKDVPFLFGYLLCTVFSLRLADSSFRWKAALILTFFTAWLISIRISGFLILFQYSFTFFLVWLRGGNNKIAALKIFISRAIALFLLLIALVIAAYPVFWLALTRLIEALLYMGNQHIWDGCTLTFGGCLPAKNLSSVYIPLWLSVKLPALVFWGVALTPFIWRRIATTKTRANALATCLFVMLFIPAVLIIIHSRLSDELRQILFIVPFFLAVGFVAVHQLFPRFFITAIVMYLLLFIADNLLLYPYQYTWENEVARSYDINKNFETDYWGASGRELALYLGAHRTEFARSACIYADPVHLYTPFLPQGFYGCVRSLRDLKKDAKRPFIIASYTRYHQKAPEHCEVVFEASRRLLFSEPIIMGHILHCN